MLDILLIMNDRLVADLFTDKLKGLGEFNIDISTSYSDSLEILKSRDYFLTLLDFNIPNFDYSKILKFFKSKNIPYVALLNDDKIDLEKEIEPVDILIKNSSSVVVDFYNLLERLRVAKNTKVLIVDDSKTYRAVYRSLLENRFFKIVEARDGIEALKVLKQNLDVKLILTDYLMPNMDGLEFVKKLRESYASDYKKIIVISNVKDTSIPTKFLKAKADDYIKKPFLDEEFYNRIYINLENQLSFERINRQLLEIKYQNRELEKNQLLLNEYKKAVDESSIVSKTNIHGVITYVNDEFCRVSGYERSELIGHMHNIIRDPSNPKSLFKKLWETILDKKIYKAVLKNRTKQGGVYYVDTVIFPILNIDSTIMEFISIRRDVTKLIEQRETIKEQSTDYLTKLPNRVKLVSDLKQNNSDINIAILDIETFKEINDFYGDEIAGELLCKIANKILAICNESGFKLYRISIDEFAILSQKSDSDKFFTTINDMQKRISSIYFVCDEQSIYINFTLGYAFGNTPELLSNANLALQRAKLLKKDFFIYSDEVKELKNYKENLKWVEKIKNAIESDNIVPFFQPIINNKTGKIEKYEALVRLIDKENGDKVISPFFFLDISKKARIYPDITKIMIEKSIEAFKNSTFEFSINLTKDDILNENSMNFLKNRLKESNIANRAVLEIVESEEIETFENIKKFITDFKALGCKIAIDDFGTGYSNFRYLLELQPDYLKIDGSLVKDIATNKELEAIVDTINKFAKHQSIKTVAEFIHSKEVFEKIKFLDVDYSQGFYLGEPSREL